MENRIKPIFEYRGNTRRLVSGAARGTADLTRHRTDPSVATPDPTLFPPNST
jgi:hypothetical protein